jgi:hypothetical protein
MLRTRRRCVKGARHAARRKADRDVAAALRLHCGIDEPRVVVERPLQRGTLRAAQNLRAARMKQRCTREWLFDPVRQHRLRAAATDL